MLACCAPPRSRGPEIDDLAHPRGLADGTQQAGATVGKGERGEQRDRSAWAGEEVAGLEITPET
jgi:hypothetical protein